MLDETMRQVLELYNRGLELYKARQFAEAKTWFAKALELKPDDGPSRLYLERCGHLIENPPPPDWDGVFTMTTK